MNKSAPHGSFLAPKLSSSTSSSSGAASASKASSDVTTSASTSASTSTSALTSGSASTSALASMSASMSAFVLKKVPASTATLRVRPFDASRRFPIEVTPCPCPRTHFFAVVVARRNDARAVEEREDVDANIIISVCLPLNSCSRSSCNGTARRRMTKRGVVIFYKKERLDIEEEEGHAFLRKKKMPTWEVVASSFSTRVKVVVVVSLFKNSFVCPKSVLIFSLSFFFLILFFWKEDTTQMKRGTQKRHTRQKAKEEEEEEEEERV